MDSGISPSETRTGSFALLVDKEATVRKALNENIVFQDIHYSDDAIWNFLLFSGYL
jgi:hypothetical protein